MDKHFYLVFNPFLDSSDEEYTQAHRFYYELKEQKKNDPSSTRYWGKISKSKKTPLNIEAFKVTHLQNKQTYMFVSDYKHLWVGKVKSISKELPSEAQYDPIYNDHNVEIWFEIDDFTIIENSQKDCANRIAKFSCFKDDGLFAKSLTSYLSGLRFPIVIEDNLNEAYFDQERLEVLEKSPLLKANVSQKVIHSITSYCIPEHVFSLIPHSAREEIIKAEIDLLDSKVHNLNSIAFSYVKALEGVVSQTFKKTLLRSEVHNQFFIDKKMGDIKTYSQSSNDIPLMESEKNVSLSKIFQFLRKAHFDNCLTTRKAFNQNPDLQFFLGKILSDICWNLGLIELRNKLAHDTSFSIERSEFDRIRSAILGHSQAGLINKVYKNYNRDLYKNHLPKEIKKAA